MYAIEIDHYCKDIKGTSVLQIEKLRLDEGNLYGFCGHNGSGKTMLFRAIAGLIRPSAGTIKVYGKIIGTDISFPESLGLMLENVGFWPHLTGIENLEFLANIRHQIKKDEIIYALDRIGLSMKDALKRYGTYSLGMKQKLAIAQAIMEHPKILILDEPTNSLDEDAVQKLHNILIEESKKGTTVLVSSHHKDDLRFCNIVFKMDNGRCQQILKN